MDGHEGFMLSEKSEGKTNACFHLYVKYKKKWKFDDYNKKEKSICI